MTGREGRLGIGLVGDSPTGLIVATALAAAGHALVGVATESEEASDRASAMLPGAPKLTQRQAIERSELVILAYEDAELEARVLELSETKAWVAGQLVLHTVAGRGTAVLGTALDRGVIPLAVHPAIEITGTSLDLHRLKEAWCAVTAPRPVLPIAQALVVELGAEPVIIQEQDRPTYAEALHTATEFTRSIVKQATELLTGIGVENPGFMLSSLVRSAADNALSDANPLPLDPLDGTLPEADPRS
ncbi:DUF2520 domain-containing protein [Pseudoclavibacter terrae]|uniref:DUF2520 domain-containing protein n=1 Tax=Pseudoclavibacter terrae TaxID=1530195 RepID=A0A7J5B790_9MICO|nr:DUF2520 domain-containing protein [Pseudoclavibacter terrae]KAB1639200.1 DUF2520 domain-containing protein [Pseudoclavibacter terrae]